MGKRGLIIDFSGFEVFSKLVSKFGNGAHILIKKEYSNQKLKIILGKPVKINKNKIEIDFFGNEILERKPSKFGTSFHIVIPREYIGKKIKIIVEKTKGGEK